jgi:hypothetical protein
MLLEGPWSTNQHQRRKETTMSTMTNGKVRKSLADQLDRLDSILDVLGDGLNEAIADAVKAAVTTAVQQVLSELLTNSEVLAKLGAAMVQQTGKTAATQAGPKKPGLLQRLGQLKMRLRTAVAKLREACGVGLRKLRTWFGCCWKWIGQRFGTIGNGLSLEGHTDKVTSAAISRDGKRVVSGIADRTVKVWDIPQS